MNEANDAGLSRRQVLTMAGSAAVVGLSSRLLGQTTAPASAPAAAKLTATARGKRFKVAGDDLFLNNRRQNPQAFAIAAKAGLDGVAVDMGSMSGGQALSNKLRDPALRETYFKAVRDTGLEISALAFFGMYAWVFADIPVAVEIGHEWVDMLVTMNVKTGFMPLMSPKGSLGGEGQADVWKRTVEVYKKFAPAAEKANVVLGVESNINADGYKRFLDEIGSPAVKVYYNPGRGLEFKFDAYKDIRDLGKDRICGLHLEQGSVPPEDFERRLGDGMIDFKKLRDVLMEIEWGGWMSIARSRLKGTTSADTNMSANGKFVHEIFPE